jgi:hypothetical protein
MPTVGVDRFEGRGAQHIISHTMEMMLACMSVIWGGVVERHPKLRIGFLESGGGWVGLGGALARPDGSPFRRSGLQRFRPEDQAERAFPAQLLDLVRARRRQYQGTGRLYRAAQEEILETTTGWSRYWLNDREFARRPWVIDKQYNAVDKLLSSVPHFADRMFPEQYATKRMLESN